MGQPAKQFQIVSKDPEKAAEFYGQLFGWKIDANNALGYRIIDTGSEDGIQGGIWPAPQEAHALVQLFMQVDDVGAAVEKATTLGANVIIQPQVLPDGDEMAMLLDTEGIPFGVFRPA